MSADQLGVSDGGAASGAVSCNLKKKKTRTVYNVCWPAAGQGRRGSQWGS